MGVIFILIVGAAAGFIATRMMDVETGVLQTIAIGVLGALLGAFLLRFLIFAISLASGFIGAIFGALALIWVYRTYFRSR
jgi:uncharacterized membrane protein YeaQ/YmgE (transglycosylase-associated protein family)